MSDDKKKTVFYGEGINYTIARQLDGMTGRDRVKAFSVLKDIFEVDNFGIMFNIGEDYDLDWMVRWLVDVLDLRRSVDGRLLSEVGGIAKAMVSNEEEQHRGVMSRVRELFGGRG